MEILTHTIDFDKYNTFFLEYHKDNNVYSKHIVRPCTTTYDEIVDTSRTRTITLEAAVMAFDHVVSISEIVMMCAVNGIKLDFIDIMIPNEEKHPWNEYKCIQSIDTHKEDILNYIEKIEYKRHYMVLNTNKKDVMRYLVIDRFSQENSVDFLKGEYDKKAILAGFRNQEEARRYLNEKNKI